MSEEIPQTYDGNINMQPLISKLGKKKIICDLSVYSVRFKYKNIYTNYPFPLCEVYCMKIVYIFKGNQLTFPLTAWTKPSPCCFTV